MSSLDVFLPLALKDDPIRAFCVCGGGEQVFLFLWICTSGRKVLGHVVMPYFFNDLTVLFGHPRPFCNLSL